MANALPRTGSRVINALSAAWSELTQPQTAGSSALKAYQKDYGPVYAGSGFYGYGSNTQSFGRDKYSAARAYYMALHVYDATRLIMSSIDTVPWQIKRFAGNDDEEGTVIADSRDIIPRHDFQKALRNYKQQHTIGLIKRTLASILLYDEVYIELLRDDAQLPPGRKNRVVGLNWLNSVAVNKHVVNGRIAGYHYSGTDGQVSMSLRADEVAYEHGVNSMSDLDGFSPVMALADKLNVETRYTLGILNWLANGIHMGGVITPASGKDATVGFHPKLQELRDILENQAKGVRNIGRWHLLPTAAQITDFGMPEFDKMLGQDSEMRKQVYASFHIPEAMMGIVDTASFKSGDEVTYRYYKAAVIPHCMRIAEFYNLQLMRYFVEPNTNELLVFDVSEYDRASEADKLEADVAERRAAVIPIQINELRKAMKQKPDPLLEGFYMVPGVVGPVPKDKVTSVWMDALNASAPALPTGPLFDAGPNNEPDEPPTSPTDTADDEPAAPLAEVTPEKSYVVGGVVSPEFMEKALEDFCNGAPMGDLFPHKCGPECDHDHSTPDAVQKQWDELDTWRKVALKAPQKAAQREFVCHVVLPSISAEIKAVLAAADGDKDVIYDAFEAAKDEVAVFHAFVENHAKSAVDYRRSVRNLSRGFWNGTLDRRTFISDMTSAITRSFTDAFNDGLKSEGSAFSDLEDDDKDALQERINSELLHLRALADWIEEVSKEKNGTLRDVRDRVDNWVRRYDSVRDLGVLVGAGNKKKVWKWTEGLEHCTDCAKMNDRVYTAKVWRKYGILPRSAELECFGIYCGCGFEDTDEPVTKGRPPALRGPR